MNRTLALLSLMLFLTGLGCATAPDPQPEAVPSLARVLVAPMNLGVRPTSALEADPEPVWQALLAYLSTRDRQIAVLDPIGAERVWLEAVADLEASGEPVELATVSAGFARRVAEEAVYDALLMPSLVVRRARISGRSAVWDGVRRPVEVPAVLLAGAQPDLGPGISTRVTGFSGAMLGASLHVSLLAPDGSVAYEGVGGLDLLQHVAGGSEWGAAWTLEPRLEPFADDGHLTEGIERAFAPGGRRTARAW